jgi:hypothetical protein
VAVRPGSAGVVWERELAGRDHALAMGEREDTEDGMRESKNKTYSMEYAKVTCGPSGSTKGTSSCGRGGPT